MDCYEVLNNELSYKHLRRLSSKVNNCFSSLRLREAPVQESLFHQLPALLGVLTQLLQVSCFPHVKECRDLHSSQVVVSPMVSVSDGVGSCCSFVVQDKREGSRSQKDLFTAVSRISLDESS